MSLAERKVSFWCYDPPVGDTIRFAHTSSNKSVVMKFVKKYFDSNAKAKYLKQTEDPQP